MIPKQAALLKKARDSMRGAKLLYEFPLELVHKVASRYRRDCFASLAMTSLRGAERRSNLAMHHDFREFTLAEDGPYDFAASRAYYTMFYVAEALLLGEGLSFSKHTAVIAAFGRRFARPGIVPAEFHRYLVDGQDMRTVGDYGTGPGLTRAQAAEQIGRAERFLKLTGHLIDPPPSPSTEGTSTTS
jgi:uncharacterized protein (UPF0332 family)